MSYINEALKKAQELKDSGYAGYCNFPVGIKRPAGRLRKRAIISSISVGLAVVFLLLWYWRTDVSRGKKGPVMPAKVQASSEGKDTGTEKRQLYDKAMGLYRAGRVPEAKKLYEALVALDPGYIEALNNLGIINIHDREFSAATDNLEKAVRLNPSYVESYYNLACLYAIKGDKDLGIEYLRKAISLNKDVREWAKNDSDLKALKSSDEFNRMVSQ